MSQPFDEIALGSNIVFLKTSTTLQTRLATEPHLADGEFFQISVNREGFLKLRGRT